MVSVNGVPTAQMTDFFQATHNGTLTKGVLELVRQGKRLSVNVDQTAVRPATARLPSTPQSLPPAGTRAAMPIQGGNPSMAPVNVAGWGGGGGLGRAGRTNPNACRLNQF